MKPNIIREETIMQNQENPRHSNQNQSDEHGRRFGEEHRPEELEDDVENEDGHRPAREPNEDPLRPIGERSSRNGDEYGEEEARIDDEEPMDDQSGWRNDQTITRTDDDGNVSQITRRKVSVNETEDRRSGRGASHGE
jgi:hypothetical protein